MDERDGWTDRPDQAEPKQTGDYRTTDLRRPNVPPTDRAERRAAVAEWAKNNPDYQALSGEQNDDGYEELTRAHRLGQTPDSLLDRHLGKSLGHKVGGRVGESTTHISISSSGIMSAEVLRGAGDLSASVRKLGQTHELRRWWMELAGEEFDRTAPKAVEYGATDLRDIGLTLARAMGRVVDDEEAAELGVYFYLLGKMSRWTDAVCRGERPSDDTLFDTGVYVRMAQRIRVAGGWPGVEKDDD